MESHGSGSRNLRREAILSCAQVSAAIDRFEQALFAGKNPRIEDCVAADLPERSFVLEELLHIEIEYRGNMHEFFHLDDLLGRFPDVARDESCVERLRETCRRYLDESEQTFARRPSGQLWWGDEANRPIAGKAESLAGRHSGPAQASRPTSSAMAMQSTVTETQLLPWLSGNHDTGADPKWIGRYRIERVLGRGGFGVVYLAHDERLHRSVAVKVPHPQNVPRPADVALHLAEARLVAKLDHPHIVPVYDVGSDSVFPCFIVSKLIDGISLEQRLKQARPSFCEAAELIAIVADALHHAHKAEVIHRDVKPGNILLDKAGTPFITDFGLALAKRNPAEAHYFAGTLAYMSPEQARGRGHQVDGRSDLFSLGMVLYELLVGRRPFCGKSSTELIEQITSVDATPVRQLDDRVPIELESICLQALAKRPDERYTTGKDLADALRQFVQTAHRSTTHESGPGSDPASLLHTVWNSLGPELQDALSLAHNVQVREHLPTIHVENLFQALTRIDGDALHNLIKSVPPGSWPAVEECLQQERRRRTPTVSHSAILEITSGPRVGHKVNLPPGRGVSIGRAQSSDVVCDDHKMSRVHFSVVTMTDAPGCCLEDLSSTNGTFVNGARVEAKCKLRSGDTIKAGDTMFRVEITGGGSIGPARRTTTDEA